ncbi:MAG: hypothetical protein ACJASQ_002935 [Crocinitomicaceae bacterium]|jgi:hypothetical protein
MTIIFIGTDAFPSTSSFAKSIGYTYLLIVINAFETFFVFKLIESDFFDFIQIELGNGYIEAIATAFITRAVLKSVSKKLKASEDYNQQSISAFIAYLAQIDTWTLTRLKMEHHVRLTNYVNLKTVSLNRPVSEIHTMAIAALPKNIHSIKVQDEIAKIKSCRDQRQCLLEFLKSYGRGLFNATFVD